MTYSPWGLTLMEWITLLGFFGGLLLAVKKLVIPWFREEIERSISSDRGIRVAIREALKEELLETIALRRSVDELTRTMATANEAQANLQRFVNEFCDLMRGELRQIQRRVDDVERQQKWHHRRVTDQEPES